MAHDRTAEQVAGVVACSNPKGFQLAGRDGWLNISKFAAGVEAPQKGAHVTVGLDRAGFVREITIAPVAPETRQDVPQAPAATEIAPTYVAGSTDRETRITRMACLNTATAILSHNGPIVLADVLATACVLEGWVTR